MIDREELEVKAMKEVCACRYYDLADTLTENPDDDLLSITNHTNRCEICGK